MSDWIKEQPLYVAGGWHPFTGRLRAGSVVEDEEVAYGWEHSEERVLKVKSCGVNLIIGQLDRGLAHGDQREDYELAKQLAAHCHKHGLKHGSYIANTVYHESMRKEEKDCDDWVVKTYDGHFAHYGGEQTWRNVACFNSPGWLARIRSVLDVAIKEVKTDLIHMDNLAVWPEPNSCHCDHCQVAFKKFLSDKYPEPAQQKARYGFTGFETFVIPHFDMTFSPPWQFAEFRNPLLQDFIEFRCWTVTNYIKEVSTYARSLNPDIVFDSNGQSVWGVNQALIHGIDSTAQSEHVEVMWEENPDMRPDDDPDAIPRSTQKMRGLNLMRKLGKVGLTAYHGEEELAFNLSFSAGPGIDAQQGYAEPRYKEQAEQPKEVRELLDHCMRYPDHYCGSRHLARIAVWRNQRSLQRSNMNAQLSCCIVEHMLFTSGIPFSIVQDQTLFNHFDDFDCVIVPNLASISDAEAEKLGEYVRQGGNLLVLENAGTYNDMGRKRKQSAFAPLFESFRSGHQENEESTNFDPNKQFFSQQHQGVTMSTTCGQGKVAYLAKLDYRYKPNHFKSNYNVHFNGADSRYWKMPYNSGEFFSLLEWLYPEYRPVKLVGDTSHVRLDWVRFRSGSEGIVLFRAGEERSELPLRVTIRGKAKDIGIYLPESDEPQRIEGVPRGEDTEIELKGLRRHAVIQFQRS